ncbi:MAG: DinB family protein [Dehalococcoidia bacterium]
MNAPSANMLRYEAWATATLLKACRPLTSDQLASQGNGTSGTVQQVILHVVGGQQTFALRAHGRQHEGELHRWSPWPGIDALVDIAERACADLIRTAEALDEDVDVVLPYQGQEPVFPRSFFLVHAVSHGAEHRGRLRSPSTNSASRCLTSTAGTGPKRWATARKRVRAATDKERVGAHDHKAALTGHERGAADERPPPWGPLARVEQALVGAVRAGGPVFEVECNLHSIVHLPAGKRL